MRRQETGDRRQQRSGSPSPDTGIPRSGGEQGPHVPQDPCRVWLRERGLGGTKSGFEEALEGGTP
jgi:hypothetical protein